MSKAIGTLGKIGRITIVPEGDEHRAYGCYPSLLHLSIASSINVRTGSDSDWVLFHYPPEI
ncbi:hypothetical protein BH10ACI2_BH10ACI2_16310 [soil metagenome]